MSSSSFPPSCLPRHSRRHVFLVIPAKAGIHSPGCVTSQSNHCPYVKHVNKEIVRLANDYQTLGVSFVAISSNDVEAYPADSPERMKEIAGQYGYSFPYLYNEDQSVAKSYQAACTPDFYIFDEQLKLVYRGQLDGSRPRNDIPVTGVDMRSALDALIQGEPVSEEQQPSIGCNIKWKGT